jgi:hypothetical protein
MTVGLNHIVMYDADMHAGLSKFVWRFDRQGNRVYTTQTLVTSADGSNDEIRERRISNGKQMSMTYFIVGDSVANPRRRTRVTDNYIDNRRSNFISLSGQKTKKKSRKKTKKKKKADKKH